MKKILVTGAAGFIGSTLVDRLLAEGYETVGIDNFCQRNDPRIKRFNLSGVVHNKAFTLYECDVRDASQLKAIFLKEKPDAVLHLAGHTGVYASLQDPEEFFSTNALGTECVLEACRVCGCKTLVFSSTGSVYGHSLLPVTEDTLLPEAANPYVASKRLAERFAAAYAEVCELNVTVLRIFSVYGPRQRTNMAVHQFTRRIDRGEPVVLYGDGRDSRNFLYIGNCVDGIILAMENADGFKVINLGEERSVALQDIVQMLSGFLQKTAVIQYVLTPPEILPEMSASITKARRVLGYEPKVSMEEGLRRFVQWYLDNKDFIHGEVIVE